MFIFSCNFQQFEEIYWGWTQPGTCIASIGTETHRFAAHRKRRSFFDILWRGIEKCAFFLSIVFQVLWGKACPTFWNFGMEWTDWDSPNLWQGDFPHPFSLTKKKFQETLPMHDWYEKMFLSPTYCSLPPVLTLLVIQVWSLWNSLLS